MATILQIDQDEAFLRLIQSTLGKRYNIVAAADGLTAIQYCAMIQPDLILMDPALSDVDGCDLAARLKIFMPHTPILIVATDLSPNGRIQTLMANSDGIFTKPVDISVLRQNIQSLLPPPTQSAEFATSLLSGQAVEQFEAQIEALNQANKRLASLNAVSALIGTSLDLEHLMDEILAQIHKTIDFDSATLLLLKGDILEAASSRGLFEYKRGMNVYSKNERNSAWRVVDYKLPLIIRDVTQSNHWEPRPELGRIRSWMGVPLIYKDRVVGVLTLDKNEPDAFSDADARYVFTLAYQIAIAVENAQLFEAWENQSTRLKLINEVAQEITTILDIDHLWEALAKAIFERLHYDRAAIFEVDETRSFLTLKAIYGEALPQLEINVYQQPIDFGLLAESIKNGQPLLVNNVSRNDQIFLRLVGEVHSELVVPIFVDNQAEAVISVARQEAHALTDHDLWTLSSLASQAATVIQNARLYHDLEQRLSDLAVLNDAGRALTSTIALGEMLAMVTERARVALGAENGYVLLVDSNNDTLTLAAASGFETTPLTRARVDIDLMLIGRIILSGEPCLFKLSPDEPDLFTDLSQILKKEIRAMLVAPLKTRGIIIGLVILINKQAGEFNTNDLNLLNALSQLMVGEVENAQLFSQVQAYSDKLERTVIARTQRLQAIKQISQVVSQGLDVDELLTLVGQGISQIFTPETERDNAPAQVAIGLIDGANIALKMIYSMTERFKTHRDNMPGAASFYSKALENVQSIDLQKPIGQVISQAKPMILKAHNAQDLHYSISDGTKNINSLMMAPLITGGKTIGLIIVESQAINAFDESDLETLETLAFQAASAIEHARLLRKSREIAIVEERTRLARDMHDGIAQNLAYLLIQVDRCLNVVEENSKLTEQLEQISSLLKQNIDELRRNIFDLRPVELEGRSLFEILENFVTEFGRRWGLNTTCIITDKAVEAPPEVESSLYRILQEILSNARQHAQCRQLTVRLAVKNKRWVTLEVKDDGQGFDVSWAERCLQGRKGKKGLGLISMRERVDSVGGQLVVESKIGQGTRIFAMLPLWGDDTQSN